MKLEGVFEQGLFLSPKVYALKKKTNIIGLTPDELKKNEIIKIKGLSAEAIKNNKISLDSLSILLNKDYKLYYNQYKWFRGLSNANIEILEKAYTLKVTENKRELIYSEDGKLISTFPIKI
jgi:hypothetical protein